ILIYVLLLGVHMMVFGEVRFPFVEPIRRQWSSYKHPLAKDRWVWQLQPALRIIDNWRRLLSLSGNGPRFDEDYARCGQGDSNICQHKLFHLPISFHVMFSNTRVSSHCVAYFEERTGYPWM